MLVERFRYRSGSIYQDGDHDDNADYNLTSGDIFDYDDAVQASGAEEIKQLYLEAEKLLVWVTYKYKLKLKNFFDPGDRGEREPRKVGWSSEHSGGCGQIPGGRIFIL